MLDLEQFYHQVLCRIPPMDRSFPIQELEDIIVVNFDCLYERDCHIRGVDQLIYLLHKIGANKRFLFISEDGALLHLSSAVSIIENVRDCFNLTTATCAVACREDLKIENVAVIPNLEAIPYWCSILYPTIKNIRMPTGPFNKKFAVWFNRGTFCRLKITRHLIENYKNDCYISYQESGMMINEKFKEQFQDDLVWAKNNSPIIYDYLWPDRVYTHEMIVGQSRKPYYDYFMEIVVETDILTTDWITEKTVKNLYIGKPFMVMGGAGTLAKIRSFGFKTFSPWIDETYDTIENNYLRLEAIKKEIDRISTLDVGQIHKELMPILEHNREIYVKYI